uniref:Uncharacterized protein n=1 Tax=Phlebotomus papatasi TaxID=29031 RepID=A0A1B0EZI3_PHLPP
MVIFRSWCDREWCLEDFGVSGEVFPWPGRAAELSEKRMPIQAPQWTEFLSCPVCCHEFAAQLRPPISLGCGHTICRTCLGTLHRKQCPFDQVSLN